MNIQRQQALTDRHVSSHALSLYAKISNIRWAYDAPGHMVAGNIGESFRRGGGLEEDRQ